MSTSVIIPAAGIGSRMEFPIAKQFFKLDGMPVLLHLLKRIDMIGAVSEIVIALRSNEVEHCEDEILRDAGLKKSVKTVVGGDTRQESVKAALDIVDGGSEFVMVHDAVRPLVAPGLILDAIDKTKELKATVAAVEVKDTIKEVEDGVVTRTLNREKLYIVQTPQTFFKDIIVEAHENALKKGITKTDDAALVEEIGQKVYVIHGSYDNIKITTYDDFAIAESILNIQRKTLIY